MDLQRTLDFLYRLLKRASNRNVPIKSQRVEHKDIPALLRRKIMEATDVEIP